MMYQAWRRPGRKPRQQRARLIKESTEQRPVLTQTVVWLVVDSREFVKAEGIMRVAQLTRQRREEDGNEAEEYIGGTHFRDSICVYVVGRRN